MKTTKNLIIFSLFSAISISACADDNIIKMGKQKSMICASCHGSNGISNGPLWPNLAGQKSAYTAKQLKAFRDGERKDPMMTEFVKSLSDEDIKAISTYYESLAKP